MILQPNPIVVSAIISGITFDIEKLTCSLNSPQNKMVILLTV